MKRFLKHLSFYFGGLGICLLILEVPIQWNYKTQIASSADWQCLSNINAEILIVGNSRVESGFDPTAIEVATEKKTFILAQTGWQAALLSKKLENYLAVNNPPDFLFVQADPIHLGKRDDWYSKSNFLKYLFLDREGLHDTMKSYQGYHWYEFYLPFIRYRGVPGRYIRDAFNIPFTLAKVKGYKPNMGRNRHEPIPYDHMVIKDESIKILNNFYSQCPDAKHCAIFPLVTPELYSRIQRISNLENYCAENQIHFANCNTIIPELPDSIFSNNTHANIWGVRLQTEILINQVSALQLP